LISPLLEKLRFRAGMRVYVVGAPSGFEAELARLPSEIVRAARATGKLDLVHAFYTREAQLKRELPKLARALRPGGILWLSYPKGRALATDLNRDVLRAAVASIGLDTVALVAIDDVWSAMRCKPQGS
jgi:hypothetical protein